MIYLEKKKHSCKNRAEDNISNNLFDIRLKYFPNIDLSELHIYNSPQTTIMTPLHNLNIIPIMVINEYHRIININITDEESALLKHVKRVKYEKSICRFMENNICEVWLNCKYRKWDYNLNSPICALYK